MGIFDKLKHSAMDTARAAAAAVGNKSETFTFAALPESLEQMRQVLIPFAAINGCSTLFVMAVTGLVAQAIIRRRGADGPVEESSDREERR